MLLYGPAALELVERDDALEAYCCGDGGAGDAPRASSGEEMSEVAVSELEALGVGLQLFVNEEGCACPVLAAAGPGLVPRSRDFGRGQKDVVGGFGLEEALGRGDGRGGEASLGEANYAWALRERAADC
eukprot:303617-Rhodomonas_salina.1